MWKLGKIEKENRHFEITRLLEWMSFDLFQDFKRQMLTRKNVSTENVYNAKDRKNDIPIYFEIEMTDLVLISNSRSNKTCPDISYPFITSYTL